MAPPVNESPHQLGFRFEPTPKQVVTYYLPRLVAGEPMHAALRPFIHAADVYACEPGVLASRFRAMPRTGERFFFTACKHVVNKSGQSSTTAVRAAGPGSWHSQGHTKEVVDGGKVKKFRYKKGGKFTDWLMDEFSSSCDNRQHVLCKMYVSPRAGPDSAARQESAFAPPATEEPVVVAANKRPAPPITELPNPKKIRIAVAPTAPVVQPPPFPSLSRSHTPRSSMVPSVTDQPAPAPAIVPVHHMARACHMPVQAPAPHRHSTHQPSVQVSKLVAQAPCSPVAARDPFCTESPAPAPAQDDEEDDLDLVGLIEGSLETEQAEEEEADDDTDWFAPMMMTKVCKETDPCAAAIAREQSLIMPAY